MDAGHQDIPMPGFKFWFMPIKDCGILEDFCFVLSYIFILILILAKQKFILKSWHISIFPVRAYR